MFKTLIIITALCLIPDRISNLSAAVTRTKLPAVGTLITDNRGDAVVVVTIAYFLPCQHDHCFAALLPT